MVRTVLFLIAAELLIGCGQQASPDSDSDSEEREDGDGEEVPGEACEEDQECDDGRFCNGFEVCVEGRCAAGDDACLSSQICREGAKACETECSVTRDADGDGVDSVDCGGDDCNDARADVFPGNIEVCDEEGVDEDCDPSTFGERDADEDGYFDSACCNENRCGDDCRDDEPNVHPTETEVCDGLDNDCNGEIDDAAPSLYPEWYPDKDGDGARESGTDPLLECVPEKPGYTLSGTTDCADEDRERYPGNTEICDGQDNDCDEDTHACATTWAVGEIVKGSLTKAGGVIQPDSYIERFCPEGMALTGVATPTGSSTYYLHCTELNYDSETGKFTPGSENSFSHLFTEAASGGVSYSGSTPCSEGVPVSLGYTGDNDFIGSCDKVATFEELTFTRPSTVADCPPHTFAVGVEAGVEGSDDVLPYMSVLCTTPLAREY